MVRHCTVLHSETLNFEYSDEVSVSFVYSCWASSQAFLHFTTFATWYSIAQYVTFRKPEL